MMEIVRVLYLLSHLLVVLQIQLMEVFGDSPVGGTQRLQFTGRYTFSDLYGNLSAS